MKLYIKNMVCNRCILVVKNEIEKAGLVPLAISLGEVDLDRDISNSEKERLRQILLQYGFEIIDDKKSRLIGKIKSALIELVQNENGHLTSNLSDYLSAKLRQDYSSLSALFSEIEGTTIEKYFIAQKIEKVKELLVYGELTLSEIAFRMNYSSVAHLSNQFKKVTGLNPSHFKNFRQNRRTPLDEL